MVNDDVDASSSSPGRRPFRRPYCRPIIVPGSSVARGGPGLSYEPSFAIVGRIFAPYGAGGCHGSICVMLCVMQKMRLGKFTHRLLVFGRRRWSPMQASCKPDSTSRKSKSSALIEATGRLLGPKLRVLTNALMKLAKKWLHICDHSHKAVKM